MVKQGIKIFCRMKPTRGRTGHYEIDDDDSDFSKLTFGVPRDLAAGFINNKKEEYKFGFERTFDQNVKQDEVFEHVAKDVIDSVLAGYNGTIFAYGQTGSGKTFTITGGAERYIDRGIIPRTLSYIFEQHSQSGDHVSTTHISYLEIYNECGYDLLDPKHEATKLEDLPKVSLMEDGDSNIHLKNLTIHPATNEEDALNLLFLGDTNRMIAETPMNQASTRSHCIFTIHISRRETASATIRRAKLHLVDLAGSERIGKTGVAGNLLTEAKYINLSLHYLEQVIVALSEKTRQHIPYRNSMMTSVLRDSLGGNCMTSMIATCSVEKKNIDESISTCRFAQRVAMIKNEALLNEELDPKVMIGRLKGEIQELKDQLALTSGDQSTEPLTPEDLERLREQIRQYIEDPDPEALLNLGADMRKINEAFRIFRKHARGRLPDKVGHTPNSEPLPNDQKGDGIGAMQDHSAPSSYLSTHSGLPRDEEIRKLQGLVLQRDNEINILVNMLKKEKKRALDATNQLQNSGRTHRHSHSRTRLRSSDHRLTNRSSAESTPGPSDSQSSISFPDGSRPVSLSTDRSGDSSSTQRNSSRLLETSSEESMVKRDNRDTRLLGDMSVGRQEAFEIFKRDYTHNAAIEDQKQNLKQRYTEAKALGKEVNESRLRINKVKSQLQHHRMQRAMDGDDQPDEEEETLKHQMEAEKASYKEIFTDLRNMKTEIEHHQHFLEKSRLQMQKDFELWWAEQTALLLPETSRSILARPPSHPEKAWRTPPISPDKPPNSTTTPRINEYSNNPRTQYANEEPSRPTSKSRHHHRGHSGRARNALIDALDRGGTDGAPGAPPVVPPLGLAGLNGSHRDTAAPTTKSVSSGNLPKSKSSSLQSSIPLTGDKKADADIMAFIKARQNLLQRNGTAPR